MSYQLYRHFAADGQLLYVGQSLNAIGRLVDHRYRAEWFHAIAKVEIETFENRQSALDAERAAIVNENPAYNILCRPKQKPEIAPSPELELKPDRELDDLDNETPERLLRCYGNITVRWVIVAAPPALNLYPPPAARKSPASQAARRSDGERGGGRNDMGRSLSPSKGRAAASVLFCRRNCSSALCS